jgi:hypothetical protein
MINPKPNPARTTARNVVAILYATTMTENSSCPNSVTDAKPSSIYCKRSDIYWRIIMDTLLKKLKEQFEEEIYG